MSVGVEAPSAKIYTMGGNMDDIFAPSQGAPLNRDSLVSFMTETRVEIRNFRQSIEDLRSTIQESVLRFESETDDLRGSLGSLSELRNGHGDLGRRIADVELKATDLGKRTSDLETWHTTQKAWLAAICFFATSLGSVLGHFLKW